MKFVILTIFLMLIAAVICIWIVLRTVTRLRNGEQPLKNRDEYIRGMDANEIAVVLIERKLEKRVITKTVLTLLFLSLVIPTSAQSLETPSLISQPGIIITLVLI